MTRSHFIGRFRLRTIGLVFLATTAASHAQQADPSDDRTYENLGCINCHGTAGEGGKGKPGGPLITKTKLPLRRFIGFVRLPINMMPPFANQWAADAELAAVYRWIGGQGDAVETPAAVAIEPVGDPGAKAMMGQDKSKTELSFTVSRTETASKSSVADPASLPYRVTLIANGKAAVANQNLEYMRANQEWTKIATDARGEALLSADSGFVSSIARGSYARERDKLRARLRLISPTARTVIVVEALDNNGAAQPAVAGIRTVLLKGQ